MLSAGTIGHRSSAGATASILAITRASAPRVAGLRSLARRTSGSPSGVAAPTFTSIDGEDHDGRYPSPALTRRRIAARVVSEVASADGSASSKPGLYG